MQSVETVGQHLQWNRLLLFSPSDFEYVHALPSWQSIFCQIVCDWLNTYLSVLCFLQNLSGSIRQLNLTNISAGQRSVHFNFVTLNWDDPREVLPSTLHFRILWVLPIVMVTISSGRQEKLTIWYWLFVTIAMLTLYFDCFPVSSRMLRELVDIMHTETTVLRFLQPVKSSNLLFAWHHWFLQLKNLVSMKNGWSQKLLAGEQGGTTKSEKPIQSRRWEWRVNMDKYFRS